MNPNPQPVTKEALVEEIKGAITTYPTMYDGQVFTIPAGWSEGMAKDVAIVLNSALDRYATAQRAEGAREEREEMLRLVVSKWRGLTSTHFDRWIASVVEPSLTPTETDNQKTV